jgi:hypothetical protein
MRRARKREKTSYIIKAMIAKPVTTGRRPFDLEVGTGFCGVGGREDGDPSPLPPSLQARKGVGVLKH